MAKSYASTVIDASADEVWARIRDFNGLATWHSGLVVAERDRGRARPAIRSAASAASPSPTAPTSASSSLAHSDLERSYTYDFQKTPFDVDNYCATIRVTPVTDGGGSFVEWWTTFDCDRDQQAHWTDFFASQVFQGGFDALKAHFAS